MKILKNPVVKKQMTTEDYTSFQMQTDILSAHKEDPSDIVSCLQKYLDVPHEIPVGWDVTNFLRCIHFYIYPYFSQADLVEWIEVFNIIDEGMGDIISKHSHLFLAEKPPDSDSVDSVKTKNDETSKKETNDYKGTKRELCVYLKFTISLLDNAVNKEVYNSVEVWYHMS